LTWSAARLGRTRKEAVAVQQSRDDEIADGPRERHAAEQVVGVLE